ncbi:hypothetical protein SFR_0651 [Streptomyces sp. FR-008]|nr:hypothetical protein SFR_0651 [Streptomyces sp. FR-008]
MQIHRRRTRSGVRRIRVRTALGRPCFQHVEEQRPPRGEEGAEAA